MLVDHVSSVISVYCKQTIQLIFFVAYKKPHKAILGILWDLIIFDYQIVKFYATLKLKTAQKSVLDNINNLLFHYFAWNPYDLSQVECFWGSILCLSHGFVCPLAHHFKRYDSKSIVQQNFLDSFHVYITTNLFAELPLAKRKVAEVILLCFL